MFAILLPGLFALLQTVLGMIPAVKKAEAKNPLLDILLANLQSIAINAQAHIQAIIAAAKQNGEFTEAEEAKWQADFAVLKASPSWQIMP